MCVRTADFGYLNDSTLWELNTFPPETFEGQEAIAMGIMGHSEAIYYIALENIHSVYTHLIQSCS